MSLKVDNIVKTYGSCRAVDGLSFEMKEPGVFALLGTNGAGKTTSIRIILGMLSADSGSVTWHGKKFVTAAESIGYLAEERGLYPKYKIMDQLMYFASLKGMKRQDAQRAIDYWFDRLGVQEYRDKRAEQLSKGNQQKIQFMTALLSDPELLILDEPLSGLDPVNADLFKSILREEIARGKYLIMSSHQMSVVEEFCTDLTILHRSRAVLQGHLNDIKKSYGRVNLHLKVEQDVRPYIEAAGARIVTEKEFDYQIKVSGEEQANRLLAALIADRIPVVTFDLREPSLHEIFVETVGGDSDE